MFVAWHFGFLAWVPTPSSILSLGNSVTLPPGNEIAATASVLFSLLVGLSVQRFRLRNCYPHLLSAVAILALTNLAGDRFFQLDLLFAPLVLSGISSVFLVHVATLWRLDRQLSRMLLTSPRGTALVQNDEAETRLARGLKLLNLVLPLSEAVVFQCSSTDDFNLVTRLKGVQQPVEPASNALWRDGVRLCERAVKTRDIVLQTSGNSTATVAVPLRRDDEVVGVLLLRLSTGFCEDDRPLLQAVGAQFGRNLVREAFAKNAFDSSLFGYFSTVGGEKKLEALEVLRARAVEQQCEASALTDIRDGIAIAYLDGTLALVNSSLLSFTGLNVEDSETLDVFSLLDCFRTGVFDEPAIAIRRVLQTGDDYERELNFDQRNQILGLRISLLRQNNAEPVGLAILVRDLTSVKEYEKLKSDMISLMSHELRTPLTSINGFAEVLSTDNSITEQAKEFVAIIANESQRMSRMINTFLSVTQLQRKDKQEVLKIPLRLDEVVRETIATLQPVAKKKRIRLVEQLAHRLPPVAADKGLITQAVKNLLHNAIKYSPERTTVTVCTALEAESVRVSIEDRGFGIPAESRDRVWEKFYRVVRDGQEKDEESTGLGLSFVREVIEQHGGSVGVDSEEGRGSKFSFTLPRL